MGYKQVLKKKLPTLATVLLFLTALSVVSMLSGCSRPVPDGTGIMLIVLIHIL